MAGRNNRFTVYDAMEAKGFFDSNPANASSRDHNGLSLYKGPIEYPKMMYHPEGKERITKQAEAISTPFGPKLVGEERRLITSVANDKEEEKKLRAEGWHYKPRDAMLKAAEIAGVELDIPESQHESEIDKLKRQIEELQIKNTDLEIANAKGPGAPKAIVPTTK